MQNKALIYDKILKKNFSYSWEIFTYFCMYQAMARSEHYATNNYQWHSVRDFQTPRL